MRIKKTLSASIATLAVIGAALTGCSPSDAAEALPSVADAQLQPLGDPGHWFSENYSEGVASVYATNNTVCGITEDGLIIERVWGPGFKNRVQAHALTPAHSAGIAWELSDMKCNGGAVYGNSILVKTDPLESNEATWHLANPRTGEIEDELHFADPEPNSAKQLLEIGDVSVFLVDDAYLVGMGTDGIAWKKGLTRPEVSSLVVLGDSHLGTSESSSKGSFTVVDGRSGETTVAMEFGDGGPSWASDGFSLLTRIPDGGGYDMVFYDLAGTETERFNNPNLHRDFLRPTPSPRDGITFSIADQIEGRGAFAIDGSGVPSAFFDRDAGLDPFTRNGKLDKQSELYDGSQREITSPPDYNRAMNLHADLTAVSRDGTMLLYRGGYEVPRIFVYDLGGKLVFDWSIAGDFPEVRIESGFIVIQGEDSTQVLLPEWDPSFLNE